MFADRKHVFQRQRLEIKPVTGVVISRNRLRIAVDHDGFETIVAQREGRMATAVIELDSLAYAIWSAAQDDDLLLGSRRRLILFFVGRIEVRRVALELRGASIHSLVNRSNLV